MLPKDNMLCLTPGKSDKFAHSGLTKTNKQKIDMNKELQSCFG